MRSNALLALFFLCGAFCGWLVGRLVPAELTNGALEIHAQDLPRGKEHEITDSKWLPVLWLFADFDLHMDVELGENMDLDLLMRQVEPRIAGNQLTPFHGRFTVLRLSTRAAGQPWLTREDALFGESRGGAELAPGLTATVWVQGRGRMLRANVAGKWLPWFPATDEFGSFALVAHGGKAVLRNLIIETKGLPAPWRLSRWTWIVIGMLGGLFAAAVARWRRATVLRSVLVMAGMVATVWVLIGSQFTLDPWIVPEATGLLIVLGGSSVLAAAVLAARRARDVPVLGLAVIAFVVAWLPSRDGWRTDNTRLDEVFGPKSGSTVSEALAQRVRSHYQVHSVEPAEHRVFLLGGQLLYDRGAPEQHLEPLLTGDLRVALQKVVDVPCLPTVDGHTAQQWRMFTQFFTGYRPDVIVFGVPRDEAVTDPATGKPRSYPSTVAATLHAAREHCLVADAGLPGELLDLLRAAERDGVPLVVAAPDEQPAALSKRLTAAIAPLLQ